MRSEKVGNAAASIDAYLASVDEATTAEDVWGLLSKFSEERGFAGVCCKCFPSEAETNKQVFFSSTIGFDLDLAELLRSTHSSNDPLLFCALRSTRPFRWRELRDKGAINASQEDWEQRLIMFGDAIVVPVFGPLIRNGYFCFVGEAKHVDGRSSDHLLHVLAQVAYLRMCELVFGPGQSNAQLSRRECEVMRKVAEGNSNTEIADSIGVSARTVETYLARIFDKLGVRDRVRASLRAYALGLLA